jgi:hypothetical protein
LFLVITLYHLSIQISLNLKGRRGLFWNVGWSSLCLIVLGILGQWTLYRFSLNFRTDILVNQQLMSKNVRIMSYWVVRRSYEILRDWFIHKLLICLTILIVYIFDCGTNCLSNLKILGPKGFHQLHSSFLYHHLIAFRYCFPKRVHRIFPICFPGL